MGGRKDSIGCRLASPGDARELSRFALQTFVEAYAPFNEACDIESYCAEHFSLANQRAKLADPAVATVVIRNGRELAGYAELRESPKPQCVTGHNYLEIRRFYVARVWHGEGVAPVLMDAIFSMARDAGASGLWLGVWEHSLRAQAFYRKCGFTRVGQHHFRFGSAMQTDFILERLL